MMHDYALSRWCCIHHCVCMIFALCVLIMWNVYLLGFVYLTLSKWALQADLDNSGTIDYTEFVAAMLNQNKTLKEDHLFAAFSYFDKDGSGYITPDELQQVCEHFGFGDIHLEEIMNEVDQDKVIIFPHKCHSCNFSHIHSTILPR